MIEAGEIDVAIDELRWLLDGCSGMIEAHCVLGELALSGDDDVRLARGHYGAAYQLGLQALKRAGMPAPVPYEFEPNQSFFRAGKGLAYCLDRLHQRAMAIEVLEQLAELDPANPLGIQDLLQGMRQT